MKIQRLMTITKKKQKMTIRNQNENVKRKSEGERVWGTARRGDVHIFSGNSLLSKRTEIYHL